VRLPALVAGLLLLTAACAANEAPPPVSVQAGGELITQVPDSLFDAGRGASVALDENGSPVISYVLLKPVLAEGELPPPVVAGQPQPPAILVAAKQDTAWVRSSVTPQSTNPAQGEAVGISGEDGTVGPVVITSLELDGQGAHHVAWASAEGAFYATDSGGSFGDPEKIGSGTTTGVSLALGSDGSPWISFTQGGQLRVAHPDGDAWTVENVSNLAAGNESGRTTAIAVTPDGQPVVAFGRAEGTVLARRGGDGAWSLDDVPGAGGFGVSMDLDQDGNPHLAYYGQDGQAFHAHAIGGGPWDVTDLGVRATSPSKVWGTGIALDDEGVHYIVVAGAEEGDIQLLNNSGGSFAAQAVPNSEGGATPSIAVSGDGQDVAVAYFDTENENLEVASAPEEGLHLAFSPPPATGAPSPEPPPAECEPDGTTITVVAPTGASGTGFEETCYAAPAGEAFTVEFDNQDAGQPHNFHIYSDSSATQSLGGAQDSGDFIVGPDSTTYQVDPLDPGDLFFRCDVHPTTMTGTFVSA
jgi:hypothetical protein